ncbi:MAG: class I SAM-dependent methyltransferase [Acidimicrobiales bacterium]|nr:class I SAM-dependent methyltransferase [Acidimicrobiales bacterium]
MVASADARATTARAYDDIVDDYVRRTTDLPDDFVRFRSRFVARVRRGGRVADIGCGPGRDAAVFAAAGLRVAALDASQGMAARTHRAGTPVALADMRHPPFRDGAVDGIWSAAALLHVPRAEVPATVRGWRRCLAADGVLGLSTAIGDHEGWEPVNDRRATPPAQEPVHDRAEAPPGALRRWFVYHRPDALLALLDEAGFEVISSAERATHRRWLQVIARARGPR